MRHRTTLPFALLLVALAGAARAGEWVGNAQAVDGQTIAIDGKHLRLAGIQAVTKGPKGFCWDRYYNPNFCDIAARWHLDDLIAYKRVTCSGDQRDDKGVPLVRCAAGDLNLNREMVRAGWATSREYQTEEDLARQEKVGMWQ